MKINRYDTTRVPVAAAATCRLARYRRILTFNISFFNTLFCFVDLTKVKNDLIYLVIFPLHHASTVVIELGQSAINTTARLVTYETLLLYIDKRALDFEQLESC